MSKTSSEASAQNRNKAYVEAQKAIADISAKRKPEKQELNVTNKRHKSIIDTELKGLANDVILSTDGAKSGPPRVGAFIKRTVTTRKATPAVVRDAWTRLDVDDVKARCADGDVTVADAAMACMESMLQESAVEKKTLCVIDLDADNVPLGSGKPADDLREIVKALHIQEAGKDVADAMRNAAVTQAKLKVIRDEISAASKPHKTFVTKNKQKIIDDVCEKKGASVEVDAKSFLRVRGVVQKPKTKSFTIDDLRPMIRNALPESTPRDDFKMPKIAFPEHQADSEDEESTKMSLYIDKGFKS